MNFRKWIVAALFFTVGAFAQVKQLEPNLNFSREWYALTADQIVQQDAYKQTVAYLVSANCKAGTVTTIGGAQPGGVSYKQVVWTFPEVDSTFDVVGAVFNPPLVLTELRRAKICPGGTMFEDLPPFTWKKATTTTAPKPAPLPTTCGVGAKQVASWGEYYGNTGAPPKMGDLCVDARGTFKAVTYLTPMGTGAYWVLVPTEPPPPPIDVVPAPPAPASPSISGLTADQLNKLATLAKALGLI